MQFSWNFNLGKNVTKAVVVAAATPPNQPQRCILTDYFNNDNFSKAQILRSLMMVIKPKHVGAVLMYILIFF
jgi:hypothetical protein